MLVSLPVVVQTGGTYPEDRRKGLRQDGPQGPPSLGTYLVCLEFECGLRFG